MALRGNINNCFEVECQWCSLQYVNGNFLHLMKILCSACTVVISFSKSSYEKCSAYKFAITPLSTLLFVMCLTLSTDVDAHAQHSRNVYLAGHPNQEFSRNFVIKPQIYHGRHKRPISNTLEEEGLHATHITLSYEHDGRNIIADLGLNENLIPQKHFLRYQKANGGSVIQNLTKTDINLCHYQGTIRDTVGSYIAVSTCNGINGFVYDGTETYYIYSSTEDHFHDDHLIFRNSDMILNASCGYENSHVYNNSPINNMFRFKRSTVEDVIRGPYNANKHSSFVELVIVVDNKVYKSFGENIKKVHNHCKDIANIVNALYVPLNIFIALVGVVVWNESNEIELSSDGDDTLKKFLHYRRHSLVQNHPNDNAQLLTKEQFEGGVVGKALKGPICTYEYSGGVSMEHSQIVAVVATTVAHEMGHNFGMEHDTSDCKCIDEKCIMSASSTSVVPHHWSSCSIDQLNVAFSHGMNYCLRNKPTKLFESPQCGNGFVELGEQCDCGLSEFCDNSCCDPNTCMLNANASCATGECCDLMTCRPKNPGTECRSAEEECDLPEYCTGESEYCPSNVYKRDTEQCDNGNAYCYKGACRSRSNQCKILWGPSGESSDHCYGKNTDGSRHGNCGYDRLSNKYLKCSDADVHCGMLHCKHLNERLEFGMESVAILSHSFMNHEGTIIPCRTVIVDLGLQSPDPGLTPNGAKCGDGKMCVNQKCITIDSLRSRGLGATCSNDCSGQGICNSAGNCHCYLGFSPPDCTNPGQGGSVNSGPATNPNGRIGFTRAMYIFFLGVVPFITVILLLSYYWRQNQPLEFRQSPNVTKLSMKSSQSPPGLPTSTPSSTDDMNSALLKSPTDTDTSHLNNTMFGKFKGFTLKPLPCATSVMNIGGPNVAFVHPVTKSFQETRQLKGVPLRSAPPVPKSLIVGEKMESDKATLKKSGLFPNIIGNINEPTEAPALPPPNPGCNARPIISNPILETSTCTARELISPLKQTNSNGTLPIRVDPIASSQPCINDSDNKKHRDGGTIKRIATFLKKEDDSNSARKHPLKVRPTIDREKLKNLKISAPMPVIDSAVAPYDLEDHQFVARSQSMRNASSLQKKTYVQGFGSMRQPSISNRPKSVFGLRPKSPPPRPPVPSVIETYITGVNTHISLSDANQIGKRSPNNDYDDCEAFEAPLTRISEENSISGSDNIYSVIDEHPLSASKTLLSPPPISGSNDSMGLLGEIVNEIEKLNVASIYSASTLKSKKTPAHSAEFAHTCEIGDYSESEYLKSNSSTTSSGYLRPSAINAPVARVAPTRPNHIGSSCKSFTSFKPKNDNRAMKYSSPVKVTRSETPAILQGQSKSNMDFVHKRNPSLSSSKKSSCTTTSRIKSSDLKKVTKLAESSLSKKPKTLSKPTVSNNAVLDNSAISEKRVKIAAENSSSDSKLLSNAIRSNSTNTDRSLPLSGNKTDDSKTTALGKNFHKTIAKNNSFNSVTRTASDKLTNVASLQQRFNID